MNKRIENVLIIKLSSIGDVLMATPSFTAIRKKYPDANISILIGEWSRSIVENNPSIDEIICIDENIFWEKSVFSLIKLFFELKSKKYDIVYQMHWSKFFNIFIWLLGIKERIGFDRQGEGIFLTKKISFEEGKTKVLQAERYLQLVGANLGEYSLKPAIYLTEAENAWAIDFLNKSGISFERMIGIAPGGGKNPKRFMPSKRWPQEYFIELCKLLTTNPDNSIVFFGDSTDTEISKQILNSLTGNRNILDCSGKLNLRQTAAIMQNCSIVIANDSGLMHLAFAVGIPTISIFGPTAPYDKIPKEGKNYFFYKEIECSPCYFYGDYPDCKTLDCVKQIKPEEVLNKINEII